MVDAEILHYHDLGIRAPENDGFVEELRMEGAGIMSGTLRTPLNRPQRRRFSAEALDISRKLRRVDKCSCPPIDWDGAYWERAACRRRRELEKQLADHSPIIDRGFFQSS
jgi:hypothetical protein